MGAPIIKDRTLSKISFHAKQSPARTIIGPPQFHGAKRLRFQRTTPPSAESAGGGVGEARLYITITPNGNTRRQQFRFGRKAIHLIPGSRLFVKSELATILGCHSRHFAREQAGIQPVFI